MTSPPIRPTSRPSRRMSATTNSGDRPSGSGVPVASAYAASVPSMSFEKSRPRRRCSSRGPRWRRAPPPDRRGTRPPRTAARRSGSPSARAASATRGPPPASSRPPRPTSSFAWYDHVAKQYAIEPLLEEIGVRVRLDDAPRPLPRAGERARDRQGRGVIAAEHDGCDARVDREDEIERALRDGERRDRQPRRPRARARRGRAARGAKRPVCASESMSSCKELRHDEHVADVDEPDLARPLGEVREGVEERGPDGLRAHVGAAEEPAPTSEGTPSKTARAPAMRSNDARSRARTSSSVAARQASRWTPRRLLARGRSRRGRGPPAAGRSRARALLAGSCPTRYAPLRGPPAKGRRGRGKRSAVR